MTGQVLSLALSIFSLNNPGGSPEAPVWGSSRDSSNMSPETTGARGFRMVTWDTYCDYLKLQLRLEQLQNQVCSYFHSMTYKEPRTWDKRKAIESPTSSGHAFG